MMFNVLPTPSTLMSQAPLLAVENVSSSTIGNSDTN